MDSPKASQLIEVPTSVWDRPFYRGVRATFSLFCRSYLRLKVDGLENLPAEGGTIVAVNHQSHLDVPLMGLALPREARFPGKAELFTSSFFLRTFLLNLGGFPIVRGEGDRKAISLSESILQRGDVLVLFPEGTRTRTGDIGAFHRGLGVLSIRTGSPIVPAAIRGSGDSLGVGKIWPRPGKISIRFAKPLIPPSLDLSPKDLKEASQSLTLAAENEVRSLYQSLLLSRESSG
ncbi:lysophospholipid acyltransferase family protein [Leptospirillum ferriphilum]|uniref:Acyltransferase n=3 Tax=Leptospirillum ferriphilum TaxID=178606 RepID=J9ZBW3_LEPFM|nr:lysophospholipid acyltransferase family protein [Leptospirillum ferriphilum]AFS53676.1 acyltransferase [Leptospirillum ferriphilum ML-04]